MLAEKKENNLLLGRITYITKAETPRASESHSPKA